MLVFCLNFPPLERTHKSSLACLPHLLSRELGFRAKNKSTGKTGKTTPPSKQLGNHYSLKGRGDQLGACVALCSHPAQIHIPSKATHGGQGSFSLLANPAFTQIVLIPPPHTHTLGLQHSSPFTETHKTWPVSFTLVTKEILLCVGRD